MVTSSTTMLPSLPHPLHYSHSPSPGVGTTSPLQSPLDTVTSSTTMLPSPPALLTFTLSWGGYHLSTTGSTRYSHIIHHYATPPHPLHYSHSPSPEVGTTSPLQGSLDMVTSSTTMVPPPSPPCTTHIHPLLGWVQPLHYRVH